MIALQARLIFKLCMSFSDTELNFSLLVVGGSCLWKSQFSQFIVISDDNESLSCNVD